MHRHRNSKVKSYPLSVLPCTISYCIVYWSWCAHPVELLSVPYIHNPRRTTECYTPEKTNDTNWPPQSRAIYGWNYVQQNNAKQQSVTKKGSCTYSFHFFCPDTANTHALLACVKAMFFFLHVVVTIADSQNGRCFFNGTWIQIVHGTQLHCATMHLVPWFGKNGYYFLVWQYWCRDKCEPISLLSPVGKDLLFRWNRPENGLPLVWTKLA